MSDQTHHDDCWNQPGHHDCAIRRVQELQAARYGYASEFPDTVDKDGFPHPDVGSIHENIRKLKAQLATPPKHLLDAPVKYLGETFARVSGTTGKSGIAFIVASGDDAKRLDNYITRHWNKGQ